MQGSMNSDVAAEIGRAVWTDPEYTFPDSPSEYWIIEVALLTMGAVIPLNRVSVDQDSGIRDLKGDSKVQPVLDLLSCWASQHQVVHIWMDVRSRGQIPFWDSVDGGITNRKIHTDLLFWDSADECQSLTSWMGLSSPFREMRVGRKETKSVLNDILEWERHELPAVQKGNIAQGGHLGLRVHWAFLNPT